MHICMDWKKFKFDWNRVHAFLVTAQEGSLSKAARALGSTQSTLSRQVSGLEKELNVSLFERVGKGLELTPSGMELLEHARVMGDAAMRLSLTASGQSTAIEGNVCISTSKIMAAYMMPGIVKKLRQKAPGIKIELLATDEESDLKRREADIAIRAFRPKQPSLITRRLSKVSAPLYIAKSYFDELGRPSSLEAFSKANFIGLGNDDFFLQLLNSRGMNLTTENFTLSSEDRLVQLELIKHGLGIGIMPKEIGDKDASLMPVLTQLEPFEAEMWLVTHRELRTSRRIKLVFDLIVSEFDSTGTDSIEWHNN